jgi:glutaredoxin-related protein
MTESLSFALHSIEELGFSFDVEKTLDEDRKVFGTFPIELRLNYNWSFDVNLFGVVLETQYVRPDNRVSVMYFKSRINYQVPNLKELLTIKDDEGNFDMNRNLETALVSIAISTHRGMLFERTRGTILHSHFIPILDPQKYLASESSKIEKKP